MTTPDADPAASALDEIRERWSKVAYVGLKPEVVPEPGHQTPWLPDVTRLLAVVDKVLGAHRDAGGRCAWCRNPDGQRAAFPCGEYLAVRAELLGEAGDAGT